MKDILDARKRISNFLFDHKDQLSALRSSKNIPNSDWVIEFANNITMAAKAPKHWQAPRPLHEFRGHPPAPQFEQMRAGKLEEYNQKMHKDGTVDHLTGEFVIVPPLIKFERTKPVEKRTSNKRGREEEEEEEEDSVTAQAKKLKSSEDELVANRQAEALKSASHRKAAVNFGLDDDDSSSDSD